MGIYFQIFFKKSIKIIDTIMVSWDLKFKKYSLKYKWATDSIHYLHDKS